MNEEYIEELAERVPIDKLAKVLIFLISKYGHIRYYLTWNALQELLLYFEGVGDIDKAAELAKEANRMTQGKDVEYELTCVAVVFLCEGVKKNDKELLRFAFEELHSCVTISNLHKFEVDHLKCSFEELSDRRKRATRLTEQTLKEMLIPIERLQ